MSFASIIGHGEQISLLQRAVAAGRLPSAYLFVGAPNIGKTLTAVQLAKAVNCEQPVNADCCDECSSCRHTARGSHANFGLVRPEIPGQQKALADAEKKADHSNEADDRKYQPHEFPEVVGGFIKIDTIRGLIASANARSPVDQRKVYVITSAEAMRGPAANCFLKTLEEPPGPTTFVLTTANASELLPTIVSRCQIVSFRPVPRDEAVPALRQDFPQVEDETIEAVAAASAGRYGWALRLLKSEQALAQRKAVLNLMASLPERQLFEGMRTAESLIQAAEHWWLAREQPEMVEVAARLLKVNRDNVLRTQMNELADVMFSWWRDLYMIATSPQADRLINVDYSDQLRQLASCYGARACQRACRWIRETKAHLRGNANLRLSAEAIMMKLISLSPANP